MIVGSLLLILVAVALLVIGLTSGSSALLIGSIAASLLAAVALVVGARQDTAARAADGIDDGAPDDRYDGRPAVDEADDSVEVTQAYAGVGARAGGTAQRAGGHPPPPAESATVTLPAYAPAPPPEVDTPPPAYPPEPPLWEEAGTVGVVPGAAPAAAPASAEPGGDAPADGFDEYDDEDPPDEPAPQVVSAADAAAVAGMSTDVLVIDGRPRYHLPGCVHLLGRESEPLPVSEAVELGFTPCSLCEPDTALLTDPRHA